MQIRESDEVRRRREIKCAGEGDKLRRRREIKCAGESDNVRQEKGDKVCRVG